ncbi:Dinitrogenase iron-molybdenum cofactor biosynthesis protein [Sulfolobus islandicus Y.N.15.51]|jgi:Uncharacterized conserved protein|uniref:Dinitrogenase iron-molybdenum cofactor biosynthesis protein n=1 Tax=Saccharolobus islandicus (strain Y.N.15.51 / Yellowstone \|nr:NifB/NifX family molybdenum-iron cluster-binding protein [Sulfolobus islandicus]ACP49611.1 Dinitrogenase iron-molybdenum cofactor biosynthesis protein [Sulfolobus islandicus Y.N.15.51]
MKVAIAVTNGYVSGPSEGLAVQIYEINGNEYKIIEEYENPALNATAARGVHMLKSAIDKGVNAVVVAEMGPPGFRFLKRYNVKAYLGMGLDAKTALEKLIKNELLEITQPTHGERHGEHYH